jgi:hypothetical protein
MRRYRSTMNAKRRESLRASIDVIESVMDPIIAVIDSELMETDVLSVANSVALQNIVVLLERQVNMMNKRLKEEYLR